jgi:hypothetical protein
MLSAMIGKFSADTTLFMHILIYTPSLTTVLYCLNHCIVLYSIYSTTVLPKPVYQLLSCMCTA